MFLDVLNSETIFPVAPQLYQGYTYNHSVANAALGCTNVASCEVPEDSTCIYTSIPPHLKKPPVT